jgi:hypothetical protein
MTYANCSVLNCVRQHNSTPSNWTLTFGGMIAVLVLMRQKRMIPRSAHALGYKSLRNTHSYFSVEAVKGVKTKFIISMPKSLYVKFHRLWPLAVWTTASHINFLGGLHTSIPWHVRVATSANSYSLTHQPHLGPDRGAHYTFMLYQAKSPRLLFSYIRF